MENRGRKMGSDLHFPHLFISLLRGEENGVRCSLSTFVHKLIEFKFELAPAVFFFCARDHLCDRSVVRATKKCANFSEPHPAPVPDQNHRNSSAFITFSSSLQDLLFPPSVNL